MTPSPSEPKAHVYKIIIAIGVAGEAEDVERFAALWIADSERRAHRVNSKLFGGRLQLLPLPETDDNGG